MVAVARGLCVCGVVVVRECNVDGQRGVANLPAPPAPRPPRLNRHHAEQTAAQFCAGPSHSTSVKPVHAQTSYNDTDRFTLFDPSFPLICPQGGQHCDQNLECPNHAAPSSCISSSPSY